MAQPTIDTLTLNAGSGGSDLAGDTVSSKFWQAILVGYSTGDGTANVVMADTGLPVVAATGATWSVVNAGTFAVQVDGAALTALQIIDDWDESDRAKVNPIVGQAGIAAGAGVVGVTVPRVTLASDDPAVVDLAAIETLITAGNVDLAALEVLVTAGNVDLAAIEVLLTAIDADTSRIPALGQAAMAASTPVVVASDQSAVPVSGTFWQATQPVSGTVTVGSITVGSITAGDNNIGNVDIVTLPTGNLGMQAMAASLSVVPASDITDATYIGDIKFGESVPAGTAIIGKIGIDQTTPGTTNAVAVKDGTGIAITSTQVGASWTALDVYVANEDEDPLVVRSIEESSWMYVGNKLRPVGKFNKVVNSIGDNVLVAAVAGRRIRLLSIALFGTSATATNIYLRDGADTNVFGDANGVIPIAVDADGDNSAGFVLPHNRHGWGNDTQIGQSLDINLSAAQYVIVVGAYVEVD